MQYFVNRVLENNAGFSHSIIFRNEVNFTYDGLVKKEHFKKRKSSNDFSKNLCPRKHFVWFLR